MNKHASRSLFLRLQLGLWLVATWHWAAVARGEDAPVRLNPYTVKADYPTVKIRFKLSGEKLFTPLDDPILVAVVSRVTNISGSSQSDLEIGDTVIAINGTELAGLSLKQIAEIVTEARQSGPPVWQIRRGLQTMHIYFDGDWSPALPGLKR